MKKTRELDASRSCFIVMPGRDAADMDPIMPGRDAAAADMEDRIMPGRDAAVDMEDRIMLRKDAIDMDRPEQSVTMIGFVLRSSRLRRHVVMCVYICIARAVRCVRD